MDFHSYNIIVDCKISTEDAKIYVVSKNEDFYELIQKNINVTIF